MTDKFGTGSEGDVEEGLEIIKKFSLDNDDFNTEPYGDECAEFVEDTYLTLSEEDDRCLVKSQVKKFVGCFSSALRNDEDKCDDLTIEKDGETVDGCGWKGSMNIAWDVAKNIRCD